MPGPLVSIVSQHAALSAGFGSEAMWSTQDTDGTNRAFTLLNREGLPIIISEYTPAPEAQETKHYKKLFWLAMIPEYATTVSHTVLLQQQPSEAHATVIEFDFGALNQQGESEEAALGPRSLPQPTLSEFLTLLTADSVILCADDYVQYAQHSPDLTIDELRLCGLGLREQQIGLGMLQHASTPTY